MSLLSIEDLSKEKIEQLIKRAIEFKKGAASNIDVPVVNIFLESSTRTLMSFEKAEENLGMKRHNFQSDHSSLNKGETFRDTIINLKAMGYKNFVIRSKEEAYWENLKSVRDVEIINAGDGTANHPTQALLDAMTIYEEFGRLENLSVLVSGDINHSRVYKSLKHLLDKFGSKVDKAGPVEFGGNGNKLDSHIDQYDVVMMLRIQHERHTEQTKIDNYHQDFGLNEENVKGLKKDSIFMHPGPANLGVEISEKLIYDHPQSRVLNQVNNGVWIRMAVLEDVCKNI